MEIDAFEVDRKSLQSCEQVGEAGSPLSDLKPELFVAFRRTIKRRTNYPRISVYLTTCPPVDG